MKTAFKYFRIRPGWIAKFDLKELSILPKLIRNFSNNIIENTSRALWGATWRGNSHADSKTYRKKCKNNYIVKKISELSV